MTNVHALAGTLPDEPDQRTILILEELLALARDGTIRQIAYAASKRGGVAMHGWSSLSNGDFALSTAIGILFHDHFAELNKDKE